MQLININLTFVNSCFYTGYYVAYKYGMLFLYVYICIYYMQLVGTTVMINIKSPRDNKKFKSIQLIKFFRCSLRAILFNS